MKGKDNQNQQNKKEWNENIIGTRRKNKKLQI